MSKSEKPFAFVRSTLTVSLSGCAAYKIATKRAYDVFSALVGAVWSGPIKLLDARHSHGSDHF